MHPRLLPRYAASTLATFLLCTMFLSSCSRAQERPQAAAATDSVQAAAQRQELRTSLSSDLERQLAEWETPENAEAPVRLLYAEHRAFQSVCLIVRALDDQHAFGDEVRSELAKARTEDSLKPKLANRITNGMVSLYSSFGILYRMRLRGDEGRMKELDAMNARIIDTLRLAKEPILPVALMAEGIFHMVRATLGAVDTDSTYTEAFQGIDETFATAKAACEKEEDRFLNGMYRTYELTQLWLLSLDPTMRKEVSEMNRSFAVTVGGTEDVGTQMAATMEFFATLTGKVARKTLETHLKN